MSMSEEIRKPPSNVSDLVESVGGIDDLAAELGLERIVVYRWVKRDSIPARYHFAIIKSAEQRQFDLSFEDIARVHAQEASCQEVLV